MRITDNMNNNTYRLYSSLSGPYTAKNAAEINLSALIHNYNLLLGAVTRDNPSVRPICVVKADGYGHGAGRVARALSAAGCDFFAVSCLEEAVSLRQTLGKAPDILILGYTDPRNAALLSEFNIIQTGFSERYISELSAVAKSGDLSLRVHLKLDTGMNRIGIPAQTERQIDAAADVAASLAVSGVLKLEGMFTHFARADEEETENDRNFTPRQAENLISGKFALPPSSLCGEDFTARQYACFDAVRKRLESRGIKILCLHVCNSAAAVRHPEYSLNAVRFGISLYGVAPSAAVPVEGLLPVMRLCSVVSHRHTLAPGCSVGYGGCFTSNIPRDIATLPIGYADGFLRKYTGGKIKIYHDGVAYTVPIVGNICMDQLTADVTDTPVAPGDRAVLFGDTHGDLEELANRAGTIPYESLCLISSRVPRYYI